MARDPFADLKPAPAGGAPGPGGWSEGDGALYDDRPARVSTLAVASLVFALLCLLPGTGAIAVVLGATALLVINASAGRLRGMGMAVAGVIIGTLTTLVWILILVGVVKALQLSNRNIFAPVGSAVVTLQSGTEDQFRAALPSGLKGATDEQIRAFRDAMRAELGEFQSAPTSILELARAWYEAGEDFQSFRRMDDIMPMPATFEKGRGWLLLEWDPHAGAPTPASLPLVNVGFWSPASGNEVWLLDRKRVTRPHGAAGGVNAPPIPAPPPPAPGPSPPEPSPPAGGG